MLKLRHPTLILISGLIWFAVGLFLLPLGLNLITAAAQTEGAAMASYPILNFIGHYAGRDQAALLLIVLGLLIGQLKGKHILGKSARKGVERILTFPNPTSLANIYNKKYYILLGSMVGIGFLVKLLPTDIRGFVDVIIGAALINGALVYFHSAYELRNKLSKSAT